MKIVWSPEAIQDLILRRASIAEESPAGAQRIVLRILHDVEHLLRTGDPRTRHSTDSLHRAVPVDKARPSRFCASSTALGDGRNAFS